MKNTKGKLPVGWWWKKLGGKKGVANIINGSTPSTDNPEYWAGDILWVTPSDLGKLNSIHIDDTERKITKAGLDSCSTTLLPVGTVLLTSRAPVGNLAITKNPICTNQGFKSFIPKEEINSLYLYFAIKKIVPAIQKQSHGNTFTEITKELVQNFEIPFPPTLDDQIRIASELERKMAEIEKMRQAALSHKEAIAAMQGAILRDVFPYKDGGKLPEGWRWEKLKNISMNIQYGISKSSSPNKVGPKLLRITDIQEGKVDWSKVPYCQCNGDEEENYLLDDGDLVFTRTGATTGKSFLVENSDYALFASYLIRVQCDKTIANPNYLYSFFQSPNYWYLINQKSRGGTLAGFNATMLSELKIPLPPTLDDQITIANELERKMAETEKMRQAADNQLEAIEALPGAILRVAFDFEEEGAS
jgi:type I restriction enzyme S subunit